MSNAVKEPSLNFNYFVYYNDSSQDVIILHRIKIEALKGLHWELQLERRVEGYLSSSMPGVMGGTIFTAFI